MSKLEQVEDQIMSLSSDELKAFRHWFAQFDAEAWDRQIEADANSGALQSLVDRALADHKAGRSTLL